MRCGLLYFNFFSEEDLKPIFMLRKTFIHDYNFRLNKKKNLTINLVKKSLSDIGFFLNKFIKLIQVTNNNGVYSEYNISVPINGQN